MEAQDQKNQIPNMPPIPPAPEVALTEKPKKYSWAIFYDVLLTIVYLLFVYNFFISKLGASSDCGVTFSACEFDYHPLTEIIFPGILVTFIYLSRMLRNYKKILGSIYSLGSLFFIFYIVTYASLQSQIKFLLVPPLVILVIFGIILFLSKKPTLSLKERIIFQIIFVLLFLGDKYAYNHYIADDYFFD